ncbi:MAG: lysophospholipid acyltransferase family protein [bacterium]
MTLKILIRLKYFLVRLVFRLFYHGIWFVPRALHVPLANALAWLAYLLMPAHRKTILENLDTAFGDEFPRPWKRNTAVSSYRGMILSSFEFIRFPRFTDDDVIRMMKMEGEEHLRRAVENGRGTIVVSAHFGNWELLAARLSAMGTPLTAVGRDQDDSLINDVVVELRTSRGTRIIPRGVPLYERIVSCLNNNELIGLVADQNAGVAGLFVDFFGKPASSFKGPGLFAVKTGAPVIPIFAVREGYEKHRAVVFPPLAITPTGDPAGDVLLYTQAYVKAIEKAVRQHPDHWMWVHKRWKTRPPDESPA